MILEPQVAVMYEEWRIYPEFSAYSVSNLEWVTQKENIKHANDNKRQLRKHGENAGVATISNKDALLIKDMIKKGLKMFEIAKLTGIKYHTIKGIKYGKSFRHIKRETDTESNNDVPSTGSKLDLVGSKHDGGV